MTRAVGVVVEFDEALGEVVEGRVVDLTIEVVFNVHCVVTFLPVDLTSDVGQCRDGTIIARTKEGGIVDTWRSKVTNRCRTRGETAAITVDTIPLATCIGDAGVLDGQPELVVTCPSLVDIEAVVLVEGHHEVAGAYRATEELDSVVLVCEDLDILDRRSRANTTQGKSVDLLSGFELVTTMADRDVAYHAAVVRVVTWVVGVETVFARVGKRIAIVTWSARWQESFDL